MLHMEVSWIEIVIRCAIVFTVLFIGIRLTGKREIGQMAPFDLVLLLLISNALQNAMTGDDYSLPGGLIAAATLLAINMMMNWVTTHNRKLNKLIVGTPTILINKGQVLKDHLERESVTHDELLQALREHGTLSIDAVRLAVLEIDGTISVIRNEDVSNEYRTEKHIKYLKKHGG